jgi:hypothetical protein
VCDLSTGVLIFKGCPHFTGLPFAGFPVQCFVVHVRMYLITLFKSNTIFLILRDADIQLQILPELGFGKRKKRKKKQINKQNRRKIWNIFFDLKMERKKRFFFKKNLKKIFFHSSSTVINEFIMMLCRYFFSA